MDRTSANAARALACAAGAFAFAVALVFICAFLCAQSALAKSYESDGVHIRASVTQKGSLSVSEERSFEFDGTFSLVGFVLDPPSAGKLAVKGVSVTDPDGRAGALEEVEFDTSWRKAGGPGEGRYAVDEARDTVYCFSDYDDDRYSVTVDYTYTNAVRLHSDVAELYWQFVGSEWDVDPGDVEMELTLPVPAGQEVVGGDNVRAWGHGSLDGTVRFAEDGTVVYFAPHSESGQFVEARVTFPLAWVPKASAATYDPLVTLDDILSEEQGWADQANRDRVVARLMAFGPTGLSVLAFIWCLAMFFVHGREHKPQFSGDYWRDVPEKGMEPAVVARIVNWNEKRPEDITATLMRLSARGAVRLERAVEEKRGLLGPKDSETYELVRVDADVELSDLERRALTLVFDKVGSRSDRVTFDQIRKYGKKHPESFVNAVDNWQSRLSDEVRRGEYFESAGEHWSRTFKVVPIVLACLGFLVFYLTDNWLPLVCTIPFCIAMLAMSGKPLRRRSRQAAEVNAKAKALKRWFKDFTNLKEALPTDTRAWGELLVYAYELGVAKQVVEQLRVAMPTLWEEDWFYGYSYWYWAPDSATPPSSAFDTTFANAISTAQAAVSAASDGGGGGGGFSGGGGGGFGGGGGGFAR